MPAGPEPDPRRLRACVEAWPDAHDGGYHPSCCRFPKVCSPHGYPETPESALEDPVPEPRPAPSSPFVETYAGDRSDADQAMREAMRVATDDNLGTAAATVGQTYATLAQAAATMHLASVVERVGGEIIARLTHETVEIETRDDGPPRPRVL